MKVRADPLRGSAYCVCHSSKWRMFVRLFARLQLDDLPCCHALVDSADDPRRLEAVLAAGEGAHVCYCAAIE